MQGRARSQTYHSGRILRVLTDPPSITSVPWNQLTVVATASTAALSGQVTVGTIKAAIISQLNLPITSDIRFRLREIRAWLPTNGSIDTTTGLPAGFSIQPYSFVTGAAYADIGDVNSRLNYAAAGYRWSSTDSDVVLYATNTVVNSYSVRVAITNSRILFYYSLLWQPNSFAAPDRTDVLPAGTTIFRPLNTKEPDEAVTVKSETDSEVATVSTTRIYVGSRQ